ncbi:MAG: polysaccharide deacetylase family protein [Dethiobacter sp.]|jgi:probable sporulation protein (polysaccharide deacetylase family)|nr:polysaccharide deacetylase family protein [Dethiobacter sp.]
MRYRYFRALCGKRVFSLILIACILPTALSGGSKYLRRYFYSVKKNVTFQGSDVGGMLPEEARAVVTGVARAMHVKPVDAVPDKEFGGVIPDLNGYGVDIDSTVDAILRAKRGESIEAVLKQVPAQVRLSDFPELAVFRGNPAKQQVTFLINVAWGNEYLPAMLDVLKEEKVGASFFLVGRWVRQFGEMALAIRDAGFELANHGDSDAAAMGAMSIEAAREQISRCNETVFSVCGVRTQFFSPHKGELSENVLKAAALENMRVIMWTVDTVDWKLPGVENMLEKILDNAAGGSLILMHPTAQTAEFLRQVIPGLRQRGLEPVSLAELLSPSYQ